MKSALASRLKDQEKVALTLYVTDRLRELRRQRDQQFLGPMTRWACMMAGDFSYRLKQPGTPEELKTIFDKSNESALLIRSVWRFVVARMCKDLFGGKDWFEAKPPENVEEGGGLAQKLQNHAECKLRECDWVARAREIVGTALGMGSAFIKTAWDEQSDYAEEIQTVLTDAFGNGLMGGDGKFFTPDDELQEPAEDPNAMAAQMMANVGGEAEPDAGDPNQGEETNEGAPDEPEMPGDADAPMEGAEPPAPSGPMSVFAKDPTQEGPGGPSGHTFAEKMVPKLTRLFARLNASPVHWRDVAYPPNAAAMSLDDPDCDFIAYSRMTTVEDLRSQFNPDGKNPEVEDVLLRVGQRSTSPQSEAAKPKLEQGETAATRSDVDNPGVKVTECYFRKRIVVGQPMSRVCLILIEDGNTSGELLWVDYLSAFSPRSQAPVHLIAVNKVPGRAYGQGMYQTYEIPGNIVDALINGVIVRNYEHCNPIKAVVKGAFTMGADGAPLAVGPGRWWEIKMQGLSIRDAVQHMELPDLDERTWSIVEMFMQLMQTESGVTNAAQGDLSNLPSNGTATGVNSLLESSSVLHNFSLEELRTALRAPLAYGIALIYFHQDTDDPYTDNQGVQAGVLTLDEAQALKQMALHVDITLTKAKKEEDKQAAMAAIPLAGQFYTLMPPVQAKLLGLYVQGLSANGIDNAETYFPTRQEIEQTVQQQNAQALLTQGQAEGPVEAAPGVPQNVTPGEFAA